MKQKSNQSAFTIIELMIATLVFSVILLLLSTGLIQIGKNYYKGNLQSRTQETARNIIDEISRGIQFSGDTIVTPDPDAFAVIPIPPYPDPPAMPNSGSRYGFCINGIKYSYIIDRQLMQPSSGGDQRQAVFVSYKPNAPDACQGPMESPASAAGKYPDYRELLGLGMRLSEMEIKNLGSGKYRITVVVGAGERDLFEPADTTKTATNCKGGTSIQFCAMSKLTTIVQRRVE